MASAPPPSQFDVRRVRARFPALAITDNGAARIYLDNPGGTQMPQSALERMQHYLLHQNANRGGAFRTSVETERLLRESRRAMADFLNAPTEREIVFGANMTSLTFALSHALKHWLQPEDEIIVTRLDHDGNIAPWLRLMEDSGARIRWLDFHPPDCVLNMDELEGLLTEKTRLLAIGYASNAVGTISPVQRMAALAHAAGAMVFVDAVQYAPHAPIDVQALGADFLACSPYKFFGPHQGVLWGRYDLLDRLPAYKARPAGERPPDKFETGTQSHEGQAGTLGALEHLAWVGSQFGAEFNAQFPGFTEMKLELHSGMAAIKAYEQTLSAHLINGLRKIRGVRIWGITDPQRLHERVPTISFTLEGHTPRAIAERLAADNIFVWDGHYYAVETVQRLGLAQSGGMLRVGAAHYNTAQELDRLLEVLDGLQRGE
jgi:cysteine desulfurase family protein (TIGR01976 family)